MLKRITTILVLSFVLILWATPMVFGQKFVADQVPLDQRVEPSAPFIPLEKDFCVIQNDDGSAYYYSHIFSAGDGVAVYMDPATCPDLPPYPFEVTDAHFCLTHYSGVVWPVQIDVNVRDLVASDSCNGPGSILCSETFTIPVDSSIQLLGRVMNLTISSPCSVSGPFFLEIVYTGGTSSPYPSPMWGTDVADTCKNWLLYSGSYWEWYDAWSTTYGNLVLRATGNTPPQESLYWKPGYDDYAPNGMPDISELQEGWWKDPTGEHTFCGPCAVANCFMWFDARYNIPPGVPGDIYDMFPLVRDYMDANPFFILWDDHDPYNVENMATPWQFGATTAPPATPQPFIPGPQTIAQVPSWGELVERLAWYFNTDGVRHGYCSHYGTEVHEMHQGIQEWFDSETLEDGSTISDTLCVNLWQMPTFALVESLIEKCEDVILLLGFWWPDTSGFNWYRCGGHYVTVAGINSQDLLIGLSDPYYNWAEWGNGPGRVLNGNYIPHSPSGPDDQIAHNDVGTVSHDIYVVLDEPISPGGLWELVDYPVSQRPWYCDDWSYQNIPGEFIPLTQPWPGGDTPVFTEVEYCVHISPWDYRGDVNVPYGDGIVNIADVVFLVNYLFTGGPAPIPFSEGDVTCDGVINIADVVRLVNYLFAGGSIPRCCDL